MTSTRDPRPALYAGLALTLGAMLVLYVDQATGNVLAGHIKTGYPSYDKASIDTAATVYLVYLSIVGVLGLSGWLATIWAARTRKPWTPWLATGLLVVGASVALFDLTVTDTSGDTGLPPLLGWVGVLPCLAGLVAVVLAWRKRSTS